MKNLIYCFCFLTAFAANAQNPSATSNLTAAERNSVIDTLVAKINALYVYEDKAKQMTGAIQQHRLRHDYDTITNRKSLAAALTKDMRAIYNDGHLGVDASSTPIRDEKPEAPSEEAANAFRKTWVKSNFNIKKLELLEGNVGLLQIDSFFPAEWIKELIQAAATFLANTDAIIIDIRNNHGFADGGLLLASYFFNESVHWNDTYDREAKTLKQSWTYPVVAGPKLADKEIFVLTAKDVFSAPEDFAYNLQALGRVKIIGEITGGGAHPTKPYKIGDYFMASIPFAYSVNPVTKTDWEGKGVQPDVAVPAGKALLTAQVMAIKNIIKRSSENKERITRLEKIITAKESELSKL